MTGSPWFFTDAGTRSAAFVHNPDGGS